MTMKPKNESMKVRQKKNGERGRNGGRKRRKSGRANVIKRQRRMMMSSVAIRFASFFGSKCMDVAVYRCSEHIENSKRHQKLVPIALSSRNRSQIFVHGQEL